MREERDIKKRSQQVEATNTIGNNLKATICAYSYITYM